MNAAIIILSAVAAVSLAASLCFVLYSRHCEKKLLDNIDRMLDEAINGTFSAETFDETLLSASEAKLGQFLAQSSLSSRSIAAEKEKLKELISDISHQTKTPIANILLYSQLLCEQEMTDVSRDCVDAISAQAEKLSFLIGSLVKTSRLEAGIVSLSPRLADINEMLAGVIHQCEMKAAKKNIAVEYSGTAEKALFDAKWTGEAIFNIIDNAIKYTAENGCVKISVTPYRLFCRIDISDNGIGIAEDEQSKVFRRFYRSQKAAGSDGVGIGLYLAREIISGQNGYIKLVSSPGNGSTFSIFLPSGN